MSKDLTDVDAFTSPIHVPENADSRNDAAGDVELVAQRLANRTHYLNQRTAKLAGGNALVGNQAITGTLGVSALTTLASLTVSGNAAIPTITGSVNIADDIVAGDDIDAGGDIYAGDDVIAENEFQYGTPPTRNTLLSLADHYGDVFKDYQGYLVLTSGDVVTWALKLPHGATLVEIRIIIHKSGTATDTEFSLSKRTPNFGAPAALPAAPFGDGTVQAGGVSGYSTMIIDCDDEVISSGTEYELTANGSSDNDDQILAIRLTWVDPGPRNH